MALELPGREAADVDVELLESRVVTIVGEPWDLWEDIYARLYSKHASPGEIKDLLTFYKTPIGQRALSLSRVLLTEGAEAGRSLAKSREKEFQSKFVDGLGKTMPALKAELDRSGAP